LLGEEGGDIGVLLDVELAHVVFASFVADASEEEVGVKVLLNDENI